jgi:hypothetical protein
VNLAYFSNKFVNQQIDEVINLNSIFLNWCDFTTLFFAPSAKAFYISPTNSLNKAISFYNQTYETTQNKHVVFNLADQIKKSWSKKFSKPESLLPPETNIQLSRQGFLTKTLRSIQGKVVALSLDEALNSLLSNNLIVPGDSDNSATVRFVISYTDTFEPLDTTIMVNFSYTTKIPCYKHVNECDSFCPYSKDSKPCRSEFCEKHFEKESHHDKGDYDDKHFEKSSHKGDFDDSVSVESEDKSVISGLTELINANKTVVSDGSW